MIANATSRESLTKFLLSETITTARALGQLTEAQRRQQQELTVITSRLSAAEESIRTMKITPPSSNPLTGTDTHTIIRRFGPKAFWWAVEKTAMWLTYFITPVLVTMWGFATEQFYGLLNACWHLMRLGLRPFIG